MNDVKVIDDLSLREIRSFIKITDNSPEADFEITEKTHGEFKNVAVGDTVLVMWEVYSPSFCKVVKKIGRWVFLKIEFDVIGLSENSLKTKLSFNIVYGKPRR